MPLKMFNRQLLDECINRDGATLVGNYVTLSRESTIQYTCSCGSPGSKGFRTIVEQGGMFCIKCTQKHAFEKYKATNIERFGCEIPTQNKEIQARIVATNIERFGCERPSQNKDVQAKTVATSIERFGCERPTQNKDVQAKVKATNIERFGCENPNQNKEVLAKTKSTNIERFGCEHPSQNKEIQAKTRATNIERFGCERPTQNKEVQARTVATNIERFGCERPTQCQEIMEKAQKNAKRFKLFTMPSGDVRKVQGFEPFALRDLLDSGYTEEQIITTRKEVPRIQYEVNGNKRYHFPDIFIPHENKIVEVKSAWTYSCKTDSVLLKKKACEERGFVYEIWCYDSKGKKMFV